MANTNEIIVPLPMMACQKGLTPGIEAKKKTFEQKERRGEKEKDITNWKYKNQIIVKPDNSADLGGGAGVSKRRSKKVIENIRRKTEKTKRDMIIR